MAQMYNLSSHNKSLFILTFAIEILDSDLWQDINEGWIELGACDQSFKVQYQLYSDKRYELNVFIWPQVAKIVCGAYHTWVRSWQFLEHRWLAFSIKHAFPVLVNDFKQFNGFISVTPGSTSECSLKFGERRYFAPVQDEEPSLESFLEDLILKPVLQYIPEAVLEGPFDTPFNVSDIRHQDALIYEVREVILNKSTKQLETANASNSKANQRSKKIEPKMKIDITLSGERILAGLGRIISFTDEVASDFGDVLVFMSTGNLPTFDDSPVFFVNIEKLFNFPFEKLNKYNLTHVYTQWKCGDKLYESKQLPVCENIINIKYHNAIPLAKMVGSQLLTSFMENPFEIELQGIREIMTKNEPKLFNAKESLDVHEIPRKTDKHITLAVCKINLKTLCKQKYGFVSGEFPIDPLENKLSKYTRDFSCTNDINNIKTEIVYPIIPSFIIMEAQMTMEVSIGLCGCRLKLGAEYSRLYYMISNENATFIINMINEFNRRNDDKITGWAINTGSEFVFFVEGINNEDFKYIFNSINDLDNTKIVFKEKEKYYSRIYFELLNADVNFLVLKMLIPMKILLSQPAVYARPTLPLPAKSALLKLGRLLESKLETRPFNDVMPTVAELRSFRIELCILEIPIPTSENMTFDLRLTTTSNSTMKTSSQDYHRGEM